MPMRIIITLWRMCCWCLITVFCTMGRSMRLARRLWRLSWRPVGSSMSFISSDVIVYVGIMGWERSERHYIIGILGWDYIKGGIWI